MTPHDTENNSRKLIESLHRKVRKAIEDYGLIDDGDKILIGLSGGKDSLALTELLSLRQKIYKPEIKVTAVHVVMKNIPYKADLEYLKDFAESRGVRFLTKETSFDESTDKRKSPCFLCSWNRRKMLFETAKELGCNKIALGHHQDDMIYTLLMNLFFQGSCSTMPPLLQMDKFDMKLIRPMALIKEEELQRLAELNGYKKQKKNCPFEKESYRSQMETLIRKAEEMNPHAKESIWNAMNNIQTKYLPIKGKK